MATPTSMSPSCLVELLHKRYMSVPFVSLYLFSLSGKKTEGTEIVVFTSESSQTAYFSNQSRCFEMSIFFARPHEDANYQATLHLYIHQT